MIFIKNSLEIPIRVQKSNFKMNWYRNYEFNSLSDRVDKISKNWVYVGPISLVEWGKE